ncbi:TlyA family RNA methyltransferase [Curvibacter sp. HBC28]|uniref:TlyA family RNA methyltransferase n=1 Tax=Curvibacter microcysteis TaxID=3026419 RepID=A0ABT5MP27_9BURK|nr:TlyA family RNA methyltransferase [Curvibacter sp. HBC28]MDD0816976.1 TlyA family RNA methyltransferase [Curvibacter sp. HBC28]
MRADQLLVERGLAVSRSQASRLIAAGVQWRPSETSPWVAVAKNGQELPDSAQIELVDTAEARYVSRGGLKLEGALRHTGLSVAERLCLDVGQSTGGFTDCLLQAGAAHVVGVDVGQGQLYERLRFDERVTCIEQLNARNMTTLELMAECEGLESPRGPFDGQFDLITGDLSFISLTLVLPALMPMLGLGGDLLMLVKPQFELQPGQVGKGVVRDPALYAVVEARLRAACAELGLQVQDWFDSPISGGDGNREFFIHARRAA